MAPPPPTTTDRPTDCRRRVLLLQLQPSIDFARSDRRQLKQWWRRRHNRRIVCGQIPRPLSLSLAAVWLLVVGKEGLGEGGTEGRRLARIHARNFSPSYNESRPISQNKTGVLLPSMFGPSLSRSSCASQSVSQSAPSPSSPPRISCGLHISPGNGSCISPALPQLSCEDWGEAECEVRPARAG